MKFEAYPTTEELISQWEDDDRKPHIIGSLAPLQWLDLSKWDGEPVPERQWAIKDRVPLNQAGLFSGEGGTGKSIIELTKNVARMYAERTGSGCHPPRPATPMPQQ